jgi:uncharacterized membrane protein YsdA (DUF1294 family)
MSPSFLLQGLGAWYLLASVVCFGVYARDKAAARRGARRTPERSLLLLGLAGGWPGGWLARHWLRHKTVKLPFRHWFWLTAVLNLAALAWLSCRLAGMG